MPRATRASVEAQYLVWITNRIASGLPPFHNTNLATTPFIAWIESLGIFSERFFFFSLRRTPPLTGAALRQAFFRDELSAAPLLQTTSLTGYSQVGTLNGAGNVVPALTGDNVEGAIYGSIFLDFARRVGLREAVGRYLNSADNNVLAGACDGLERLGHRTVRLNRLSKLRLRTARGDYLNLTRGRSSCSGPLVARCRPQTAV
ncbi:MAG: hypothetical protein DYH03_05060 [Nitrospira sp. NTP1]|nr:hypothetical protein [Nitrospira sp. NTP1]